jgi:hypothetical protein
MSVPTAGRTHLVLVGATGMVGRYALRYALEHPAVERVTAIVRRTLGISHTKLNEAANAAETPGAIRPTVTVLPLDTAAPPPMPAAASSLRRLSSRSNSVSCAVMAARLLHGVRGAYQSRKQYDTWRSVQPRPAGIRLVRQPQGLLTSAPAGVAQRRAACRSFSCLPCGQLWFSSCASSLVPFCRSRRC